MHNSEWKKKNSIHVLNFDVSLYTVTDMLTVYGGKLITLVVQFINDHSLMDISATVIINGHTHAIIIPYITANIPRIQVYL